MRYLLTGATSFTGRHFTRALVRDGHEVHIALRGKITEYAEERALFLLDSGLQVVIHENVRHDNESLSEVIRRVRPDVLHMHAHPMTGFRQQEYDFLAATGEMTAHMQGQLLALSERDDTRVVYSGSYYEPTSLFDPAPHPAVSYYGLSKHIVGEVLRMLAHQIGLPVGKFVIPNPYGPGEVGRFGNYLVAEWAGKRIPVLRTPEYFRDNIPVQELTLRYVDFVTKMPSDTYEELRPSGYRETQLDFARRMATEFGSRLDRVLTVDFDNQDKQDKQDEPLIVQNDGSHSTKFDRNESEYWSQYFDYYSGDLRS